MIFVSHDRSFLRGLSNRVLELGGESGTDAQPLVYPGLVRRVRRRGPGTKRRACMPEMPLITLDHVRMAFGHLPLLDDASLLVDAGRARRGHRPQRHGQVDAAADPLGRARAGRGRDLARARAACRAARAGRRARDRPQPSSTSSPRASAISASSSTAYHHAAVAVAERPRPDGARDARPAAARARRARRLDARAARRARAHAAEPAGRRARRRRCRAAGGGACCWRARSSPSRRCCCSTSRRTISISKRSSGSRTFLADYPGAIVFVTHDRAFLQRLATRIVELDRGRLTSWPGDYRDVPREEGSVARERGAGRREVRQEAGAGRSRGCGAASRRGGRATRAASRR